jgi:hypothetical protein
LKRPFHASLHPHQVIAAIVVIAAVAMVHRVQQQIAFRVDRQQLARIASRSFSGPSPSRSSISRRLVT